MKDCTSQINEWQRTLDKHMSDTWVAIAILRTLESAQLREMVQYRNKLSKLKAFLSNSKPSSKLEAALKVALSELRKEMADRYFRASKLRAIGSHLLPDLDEDEYSSQHDIDGLPRK